MSSAPNEPAEKKRRLDGQRASTLLSQELIARRVALSLRTADLINAQLLSRRLTLAFDLRRRVLKARVKADCSEEVLAQLPSCRRLLSLDCLRSFFSWADFVRMLYKGAKDGSPALGGQLRSLVLPEALNTKAEPSSADLRRATEPLPEVRRLRMVFWRGREKVVERLVRCLAPQSLRSLHLARIGRGIHSRPLGFLQHFSGLRRLGLVGLLADPSDIHVHLSKETLQRLETLAFQSDYEWGSGKALSLPGLRSASLGSPRALPGAYLAGLRSLSLTWRSQEPPSVLSDDMAPLAALAQLRRLRLRMSMEKGSGEAQLAAWTGLATLPLTTLELWLPLQHKAEALLHAPPSLKELSIRVKRDRCYRRYPHHQMAERALVRLSGPSYDSLVTVRLTMLGSMEWVALDAWACPALRHLHWTIALNHQNHDPQPLLMFGCVSGANVLRQSVRETLEAFVEPRKALTQRHRRHHPATTPRQERKFPQALRDL